MKKTQWMVTLGLFPFLLGAGSPEVLQLVTLPSHSRIVIPVDQGIPLEWKPSAKGFEILLKEVTLSDLSVPVGGEDFWKTTVEGLKDNRVDGLKVAFLPQGGGIKISGKWKFPEGRLALAHPTMESFGYRQQQPPRFMVDFWFKEGPTVSEAEERKYHQTLQVASKKVELLEKQQESRKKQEEAAYAKVIDPEQFCHTTLNEEDDVILRFYPFHQKFDFFSYLPDKAPDLHYAYKVPSLESILGADPLENKAGEKEESPEEQIATSSNQEDRQKELQYIRLAFKMYETGKIALTIRVLDFIGREFPHSSFYKPQLQFLKANATLKLGFKAEGEEMLQNLMKNSKGTEEALQASLYLLNHALKNQAPLLALDHFMKLIQEYPKHPWLWVFHMGAAESFYALKNTLQAVQEYQWVIDHAPDAKSKSEALFRMGDLYMVRFQYEQALAAYYKSLKMLSGRENDFPSLIVNRGETFYQLGQDEKAKEVFLDFLKRYPSHPVGWRATFRLAEIEAKASRREKDFERSQYWYYETVNHYPFSPGEVLARIRLAPCGDHGQFKLSTLERFFLTEVPKLLSGSGAGEVYSKGFTDLTSLSFTRALISLGSLEQVMDRALIELAQPRLPNVRDHLNLMVNWFFKQNLERLLSQNKKFEALQLYTLFASRLPKPIKPLDFSYILRLSQAALDLRLTKMSQELYDRFRDLSKEEPRGDAEIHSVIAQSSEAYLSAKALWLSKREEPLGEWNQELRRILSGIHDESEHAYEREVLLGLLELKEGRNAIALHHALDAQLMHPSSEINYWVAILNESVGNTEVELEILKNMESSPITHSVDGSWGLPQVPELGQIVLKRGDLLEKEGRWGEAAMSYQRALELKMGGDQLNYRYANSLLNSGDMSKESRAVGVLEKMAQNPAQKGVDGFWKKLAETKLAELRAQAGDK